MSRDPPGRDIGPDEDRPHRYGLSETGGLVSSPSEDVTRRPGQHDNDLQQDNDLQEDTANPRLERSSGVIRGRPGYMCQEPVDASPASEAEIYNSIFPQRQRTLTTSEHYKLEENRLTTFSDWPRTAPVRKEDLARNGFIYTGSNDQVRCVYCGGVLRQWERGDVVECEHHDKFPQCPFVRGEDVGNIPFQPTVNGHHSEPARMSSRNCEERGYDIGPDEDRCGAPQPLLNGLLHSRHSSQGLSSNVALQSSGASEARIYSSRPRCPAMAAEPDRLETFASWPAQMRQRPEQLAQAGLYYIGDSDKVKCFYCDGLLYNWEPEDDPFVEHARWFPNCQYMRLIKGDDFIRDVQSGRVHNESVMHTPAVLAVLSEGHSVERVQHAITLLKQREGANVLISAEKLLAVVMELEMEQLNVHSCVPDNSTGSADIEHLQRENESLRDKQLCKICMERDVEVIFYPCKHFVCCAMCGAAVSTCPICRQPIQSLDKVFMA